MYKQIKKGCAKCGRIILADTEEWHKPLCYSCYSEVSELEGLSKLRTQLSIARDALEFLHRGITPDGDSVTVNVVMFAEDILSKLKPPSEEQK